ncbi:plasmalemma vesicle associated protein a isoform X2 [Triplophysa dalaica]|uniref:plasmalemma vesicle associated protein a isoform X2 n=1 Tax=Triplophysa dalaica TaxID=1582913 RepID=UPI0024DF6E71|nr:plasmalemma vesicle associated protein a isoform X2 [Triplophysa dalaica]
MYNGSYSQSLIIASLVLFLVYGQPEHTVEEKRLQELDQTVGKLTMENYVLREKEKNLTKYLNITLTVKKANDKDLFELRRLANISSATIRSIHIKMSQCEMEKRMPSAARSFSPTFCPDPNESNKQLRLMLQQSAEMLKLVKANFTQKMDYMKTELENSNKGKDQYHLDAIELRRDKAYLQEELKLYQKKCKDDFVASLQGIPNVTKEFLKRIDDLFSKHISFQLTCDKQKHQLENIRENCSSLSREVESKLQSYLDVVGNQFTNINKENSKYVTENKRFREDADWCNQNRSEMVRENRRVLEQIQLKHDQETKQLLLESKKFKGENRLNEDLLSVKENKIKMLQDIVNTLNTSLVSCKPPKPYPFGMPNIPSAGSSMSWGSLGSFGISQSGPGSSRTGISQTGTSNLGGLGTGFGSAGSSASSTGSMGSGGTGSKAFNSAASSGAGVSIPGATGVGFGSAGSNTHGFGMSVGGVRTGGSDSALLNQAQISLHLRELHRYSVPS